LLIYENKIEKDWGLQETHKFYKPILIYIFVFIYIRVITHRLVCIEAIA